MCFPPHLALQCPPCDICMGLGFKIIISELSFPVMNSGRGRAPGAGGDAGRDVHLARQLRPSSPARRDDGLGLIFGLRVPVNDVGLLVVELLEAVQRLSEDRLRGPLHRDGHLEFLVLLLAVLGGPLLLHQGSLRPPT